MVEREHVDNGEAVGCLRIDSDDGRIPLQFVRRRTLLAAPHFAERGALSRDVLQRGDERTRDLGATVRRRLIRVMRVFHDEAVQHQPIGQRIDFGGENPQSVAGQRSGEPMEDPGRDILVGAHGVLRGARLRIELRPGDRVMAVQRPKTLQFDDDTPRVPVEQIRAWQGV